jgi:hypothetical protein
VEVVFALATEDPELAKHQEMPSKPKTPGAYNERYYEFKRNGEPAHSIFDFMGPKPTPTKVQILGKYVSGLKPYNVDQIISVQNGD